MKYIVTLQARPYNATGLFSEVLTIPVWAWSAAAAHIKAIDAGVSAGWEIQHVNACIERPAVKQARG